MTSPRQSIARFYAGWDAYNERIIEALRAVRGEMNVPPRAEVVRGEATRIRWLTRAEATTPPAATPDG